uniref:Tetratricopeptide repeat protein 9C-like n=1 Tax=Diabrotica virgifera virgifera TaxID=50390 RepID=A0A6P7G7W2_DIAVI
MVYEYLNDSIKKEIIEEGQWGDKPDENSKCTITILDYFPLKDIINTITTIGDADGDLWRSIQNCLLTMHVGEKSKFVIKCSDNDVSLVIILVDLVFDGHIYEWPTNKKVELALCHKEKGNVLFKLQNSKDAAFRFIKGLKILHSIPIDAEQPPDTIEDVPISRINNIKETLYNNLSSCYFRNKMWEKVIPLGKKVLTYDPNNAKSLYRLGVAYENCRDFERSFDALSKLLQLEPDNKACCERLSIVKVELRKAEIRVNDMVKKMFPLS